MFNTVFALAIAVFCFKTVDCHPVTTNTTVILKPDVRVLVTSFKNETGHCTATTKVDISDVVRAGKYQINVQKSSKSGHILTDTKIYVLENEESRMVIKPFRPDYKLLHDLGYYKFHMGALKWSEARRKCAEEDAHLVIINSQKEAEILVHIMSHFPADTLDKSIVHKDYVLIGFHDYFEEGEYLTIFGAPLTETGFTKWGKGQPDNAGVENCGSFHRSGVLNDFPCAVAAPFICEKEVEYQHFDVDVRSN